MHRITIVVAFGCLIIGVMIGINLRALRTSADDEATPAPTLVEGFTGETLAQIFASEMVTSGGAGMIGVQRADGTFDPASLSLTRYTYQPSGYLALPYPYPGPVVYSIESGTLTLEAIGPEVRIVDVEPSTSSDQDSSITIRGPGVLNAGGRYEVPAGDYFYAFDGNLGPTRNDGDETVTVLAVFLQPEMGGDSEESFGTPIAGSTATP